MTRWQKGRHVRESQRRSVALAESRDRAISYTLSFLLAVALIPAGALVALAVGYSVTGATSGVKVELSEPSVIVEDGPDVYAAEPTATVTITENKVAEGASPVLGTSAGNVIEGVSLVYSFCHCFQVWHPPLHAQWPRSFPSIANMG